jgi:inhibitor of KinA
VHYDPKAFLDKAPGHSPFELLSARVVEIMSRASDVLPHPARMIEIPVCYGREYGEDIRTVCAAHGLSEAEVIALHTAPTYFVGMLGFAPGFPYLAGLDERLVTPRRATPRPRVPRGSVAIGGEHTGIYPFELPGGWHLIGRTPLALFDPSRDPPSLLAAGDQVRFVPIASADCDRLATEGLWR